MSSAKPIEGKTGRPQATPVESRFDSDAIGPALFERERSATLAHHLSMNEPSPDELAQIDARSHELIREFLEHKQEAKALDPHADDSRVFEGWAI